MSPRALAVLLLERGVLPPDAVSSGLTIVPFPGRNCNHQIAVSGRPLLFVKQPVDTAEALRNEADIYLWLERTSFARYLPSIALFDDSLNVLALKCVEGGTTLEESFKQGRQLDSVAFARLGRAIAALHALPVGARRMRRAIAPFVLSLAYPPFSILRSASRANVEIVRVVQNSKVLCAGLLKVSSSWRSTALIHNDLRLANCLVRRQAITLIDWELAGVGDPDWDVASILSNFLALWLFSMDSYGPSAVEIALTARYRVGPMRPAIREFWTSYTGSSHRRLGRLMTLTAARLIQLAYERERRSSSMAQSTICALQVAENIMRRPDSAAADLFGL